MGLDYKDQTQHFYSNSSRDKGGAREERFEQHYGSKRDQPPGEQQKKAQELHETNTQGSNRTAPRPINFLNYAQKRPWGMAI